MALPSVKKAPPVGAVPTLMNCRFEVGLFSESLVELPQPFRVIAIQLRSSPAQTHLHFLFATVFIVHYLVLYST
jgi:hypothetical protein